MVGLINVNCYETRCGQQLCHLTTQHMHAWCLPRSSSAAVQNSTSFCCAVTLNSPELTLVDYKLYSSLSMNCKSLILKKSNSDWLNSGKAVIQQLSEEV